jgi:hypothetical protein
VLVVRRSLGSSAALSALLSVVSCGGKATSTAGSLDFVDAGASHEGGASRARDGGNVVGAERDAGALAIADAGVADAHPGSVDSGHSEEAGIADAGAPVDAGASGPDGCSPSLAPICRDQTLVYCDGAFASLDCATYFVDSTHPAVLSCATVRGRATCASPPGGTCWTSKNADALLLPCLGEEAGCVVHADDSSECAEKLGTCTDYEPLHGCRGPYQLSYCSDGEPIVADCRDLSPDATCGFDGTHSYCENVAVGGSCDADSNGVSDIGMSTARCAPGLVCADALGPGSGRGVCLPPPADPCTTTSKTVCDGTVLRTCFGGVPDSVDCALAYGNAPFPLRAACTILDGIATCAAHVGDRCQFQDGDDTSFVGCLGVDAACVTFVSGGSECREHVGTCSGTGPTSPACFGAMRATLCRQGQPLVADCAYIGSRAGATCGTDGTSNWCKDIQLHGMCDSDADGSNGSGARVFRCAPGTTCLRSPAPADAGDGTGGCELP